MPSAVGWSGGRDTIWAPRSTLDGASSASSGRMVTVLSHLLEAVTRWLGSSDPADLPRIELRSFTKASDLVRLLRDTAGFTHVPTLALRGATGYRLTLATSWTLLNSDFGRGEGTLFELPCRTR